MVKNEDGTLSRGYKLATLRTLLDSAGLLTHVALSAIQVHDMALWPSENERVMSGKVRLCSA